MKNFIKKTLKKIWHWSADELRRIKNDTLYHFLFGFLIATFCFITLKIRFWSILVIVILAFLKEICGFWIYRKHFWKNIISFIVGGIIVILFILI